MKHPFPFTLPGLLIVFALLLAGCQSPGRKQASRLVVGSYNLRCTFFEKDARQNWSERLPRMVRILRQYKPDIFGTQEGTQLHLQALCRALPYRTIGRGREHNGSGETSAIFYNPEILECLHAETFQLSETPDIPGSRSWNTACPRICTWGLFRVKSDGTRFVFANTHLDHKSPLARQKGVQLILDKLSPLAEKHPLILTGDFNSFSHEDHMRPLMEKWRSAHIAAETRQKDLEKRNSYNGYRPASPKHDIGPIDYVFCSDRIRIINCLYGEDGANGLFASDHYPVLVSVGLPASGQQE